MKRHVVKNLRLNEISTVDRPAQVGAVSVLIKRGEAPEFTLAKATFQEALEGQLVASRVNEAFYQSFNGLWERNDAFRTALTDELAEGGDGSTASAAYVNSVKTLVDEAVANARSAGAEASPEDLAKAFTEAASAWLEKQETDMKITNRAELKSAVTSALAKGLALTMGEVATIQKAATDLKAEDELPAEGPLAKAAAPVDVDLQKRLDRIEKRDGLSVDLRKHYDGLADDAARDAFLALDATAQQAELTKAGGDDPVVYTTLAGIQLRKSAGDALIAMAKDADETKRDLAKARTATEDVTLEKRAGEELGNVGGDLVGKKALLKAVDAIADEPTRTAALAVLKSANTVAAAALQRRGSSGPDLRLVKGAGDGAPGENEAETELDELAKAYAAEHKVDYAEAYAQVTQTVQGQELYKRAVEG